MSAKQLQYWDVIYVVHLGLRLIQYVYFQPRKEACPTWTFVNTFVGEPGTVCGRIIYNMWF